MARVRAGVVARVTMVMAMRPCEGRKTAIMLEYLSTAHRATHSWLGLGLGLGSGSGLGLGFGLGAGSGSGSGPGSGSG